MLYVAVSREHVAELKGGSEVVPDERSGCFKLYTGPATAALEWTPAGGEHRQEEYAVMEMEIFASGFLQKYDNGILKRVKGVLQSVSHSQTEYHWYGPLKLEESDGQERTLYRMSEMDPASFM